MTTVEKWTTTKIAKQFGIDLSDNIAAVRVDYSPLGKFNGLFTTIKVKNGEAICLYPGVYVNCDTDGAPNTRNYCVTVNAFPKRKEWWVVDAFKHKHSVDAGLGHFVNSSHPQLPSPYNFPNSIYVEETPQEFNTSLRPPLVFVVADRDIDANVELLVDYHWVVNGKVTNLLRGVRLSCKCAKCIEFLLLK